MTIDNHELGQFLASRHPDVQRRRAPPDLVVDMAVNRVCQAQTEPDKQVATQQMVLMA